MRKISRIALKVTVKKFINFVYGNVKKITIVAYKQKSAFVVRKEFFKPAARFNVKIVRRFVKKQNVRVLHKGFCKCNPHLPSAGKFFRLPRKVVLRKSQSDKYAFGLRFTSVPAGLFKLRNQTCLPFQKRLRTSASFLKHISDFVDFFLNVVAELKRLVRFFAQGASVMRKS